MTGEPSTGKPSNAADYGQRVTHVVAGAVTDAAGRILIAQRPPGKRLAGSWEFPGGKLEPGETRVPGLARELHEELGITIGQPRPLMRVRHTYPFGDVLIDMWVVSRYSGEPRGLDGQALRWCSLDEVATADLLPADRPIVRALWLPERLTVCSSRHYRLSDAKFFRLSANREPEPATQTLSGASCRDVDEASHAAADGADFLVMSCELPAAEVKRLCESVLVPVFVCDESLEGAWLMGATGVSEIVPPLC